MTIIAHNLKLVRKHKKISQVSMAKDINCESQLICKIERGDCYPKVLTLLAMCDYLGIEDLRKVITTKANCPNELLNNINSTETNY